MKDLCFLPTTTVQKANNWSRVPTLQQCSRGLIYIVKYVCAGWCANAVMLKATNTSLYAHANPKLEHGHLLNPKSLLIEMNWPAGLQTLSAPLLAAT
jgi:hypothetical protein